jgi:hypothetical protein
MLWMFTESMYDMDTLFSQLSFPFTLQYMFGVIRDSILPMVATVHHENPKILLDSFDRNITKNLNEVIL